MIKKIGETLLQVIKKIGEILLRGLRGAVADFWMLPAALILAVKHSEIANMFKLFPTMTPEKVSKIIPALILFLLVMFLVRLYFWAQYPGVYKESLMSKRNKLWLELPSSQRFLYSRIERWVLLIAFAAIITAM
jgi:hypothetical protein